MSLEPEKPACLYITYLGDDGQMKCEFRTEAGDVAFGTARTVGSAGVRLEVTSGSSGEMDEGFQAVQKAIESAANGELMVSVVHADVH